MMKNVRRPYSLIIFLVLFVLLVALFVLYDSILWGNVGYATLIESMLILCAIALFVALQKTVAWFSRSSLSKDEYDMLSYISHATSDMKTIESLDSLVANVKDLNKQLSLKSELLEDGIKKISKAVDRKDYAALFVGAKQIDLCFNSGSTVLLYQRKNLISAINSGAYIRVLFSDIELGIYDASDQTYATFATALCPGTNTKNSVKESIGIIESIQAEAQNDFRDNIKYGYAQCYITGQCIIIDEELVDFIPYLPYQNSIDSIRLELYASGNSRFAQPFVDMFNAQWEKRRAADKQDI